MEGKEIAAVVGQVLNLMDGLTSDERRRVLQTAATFFDVPAFTARQSSSMPKLDNIELGNIASVPFSDREIISPKEFLIQKQPRTEPQRIACLAFYLSHYRDTPNFKSSDLATLNIEAAQPKITNIARSAFDALRSGYITSAGNDRRQLSALGEQFVLALPDSEAAKSVMSKAGRQSRLRSSRPSRNSTKKHAHVVMER